MEKSWFNLILSKGELEYRCELSKSMDSLGPVENISVNEDPARNDTDKNIRDCSDRSSYYSKADDLVGVKDIWNFIFDDTILVRDGNQDSYYILIVKTKFLRLTMIILFGVNCHVIFKASFLFFSMMVSFLFFSF